MSGVDGLFSPGNVEGLNNRESLFGETTPPPILHDVPKAIGESSKLTAIRDGALSAGGSILKGLGALFRGGAYLVNGLVALVNLIVVGAVYAQLSWLEAGSD